MGILTWLKFNDGYNTVHPRNRLRKERAAGRAIGTVVVAFLLVEKTAGPSTTLPRISCRGRWRRRTSCGFLTESRTRGPVQRCVAENPGTLRSG
jgi:hypothetical protein